MESLGGDQRWLDRFFAQHAAVLYYWVLVFLWLVSPTIAYNFSELIEAHAVDTYAEFVDANEEELRKLPAPSIAKKYYEAEDLHYFDEFQTSRPRGSRRPKVDSLYDVFCQIRDDEGEHVATMSQCQDSRVVVRAPSAEAGFALAASAAAAFTSAGIPQKFVDELSAGAEGSWAEPLESLGLDVLLESLGDTWEELLAIVVAWFEQNGLG